MHAKLQTTVLNPVPVQVILVRDAESKSKVAARVGKKAMVLTVVEAKGLEFQVSLKWRLELLHCKCGQT